MTLIRKTYLVAGALTSVVRAYPRYEIELVRAATNPEASKVRSIDFAEATSGGLTVDVGTAKEVFTELHARYPEVMTAVYPTLEAFAAAFDATLERDAFGGAKAEDPINDDTSHEVLLPIDGVGEDLAKKMFAAGLESIQAVAVADLDVLESVEGIGPQTAVSIQKSAIALVEEAEAGETAE